MRMGQVNDFVRSDSTMEGDSGSPNNCPTSYTMIIMLMENYTGQTYQDSGQKGELESLWMDNGFGRGNIVVKLHWKPVLEIIQAQDQPGTIRTTKNGEEITVSWRVVGVEVTVAPVVAIDA
ncbi:MAG: hypothetical protein Ct9H90mP16_08970 [Candidatus Poseidoniales archaeon]|nr:MAG: hypothetical protein Ct9H90mP16_08970 [Candidatus Poseidoniales archaeon]